MSLPPEVWSQIVLNIPSSHLAPLLHVSRMFHDLAIAFLFSAIKIYFIGGHTGLQMLNTFHEDFMEETVEKLMTKSWGLLRHVTRLPRFAKVVKSVTVIAFADAQSIFELLSLEDALDALPNLRTFRWIGTRPGLSDSLAKCIPPSVQTLSLQTYASAYSLRHLGNVANLSLPTPFYYPDDEEAHDDMVIDEVLWNYSTSVNVREILDVVSQDLQSLVILTQQITQIPIRICNSLRTLEVCAANGAKFTGLDLVFRHAVVLESLTLVGYLDTEIFSLLPEEPPILPHLTSFRLSSDGVAMPHISEIDAYALGAFLRGRSSLRRLYLRLPAAQWNVTSNILAVISNLHGLEVLGLHTGCDSLSGPEIDMVAKILSKKLRALHLAVNWGGSDLLPLIDAVAQLPLLSFLHLYGVLTRLPLLLEDLAGESKGLKMVGLNRALWDINRTGSEITLTKWPRWKVKFSMVEDFYCADDAWLFKYN